MRHDPNLKRKTNSLIVLPKHGSVSIAYHGSRIKLNLGSIAPDKGCHRHRAQLTNKPRSGVQANVLAHFRTNRHPPDLAARTQTYLFKSYFVSRSEC